MLAAARGPGGRPLGQGTWSLEGGDPAGRGPRAGRRELFQALEAHSRPRAGLRDTRPGPVREASESGRRALGGHPGAGDKPPNSEAARRLGSAWVPFPFPPPESRARLLPLPLKLRLLPEGFPRPAEPTRAFLGSGKWRKHSGGWPLPSRTGLARNSHAPLARWRDRCGEPCGGTRERTKMHTFFRVGRTDGKGDKTNNKTK